MAKAQYVHLQKIQAIIFGMKYRSSLLVGVALCRSRRKRSINYELSSYQPSVAIAQLN